MIMEPHAGDRPAAPARRGNPAVACTAATVPRVAAAKAGRASAGDAAGSPGSGRAAGGRRCRGYIVGGPLWWQLGRGLRRLWLVVAVLAAIPGHRGGTWPRGAQQKRANAAVIRARPPGRGRPGRGRRGPGPGPTWARAGAARPRASLPAHQPADAPARRRTSPLDTAANLDPDRGCTSTPARGRRVSPNPARRLRVPPRMRSPRLRWRA